MKSKKDIYSLVCLVFASRMILNCLSHPRNVEDIANLNNTNMLMNKLLNVFGLPKPVSFTRLKHPPPQYMLDLYRSFSSNYLRSENSYHYGANTVRSFFSESDMIKEHYKFDISAETYKHEVIVEAQFHFPIHQHASQHNWRVFQISLYDISGNSSSRLVETRLTHGQSTGWEVFRITNNVQQWMEDSLMNKGLTVKVSDFSEKNWSASEVHNFQRNSKPILVIFSYDLKDETFASTRTSSKNLNSYKSFGSSYVATTNQRNSRSASTAQHNGDCARRELRVDFEKLGWSSWIISPKWYDAYVCSGQCAFPLGQNQQPTNHATVQSIVHEMGLDSAVDAPCCVPTELHPVNLLYFDEDMNVVLKEYDGMVAAGCGCQ